MPKIGMPRYNSMLGVARYFLGWGMQSTEGSKGNVLTEKTRFFSPTILEHQVLKLKFHEPDRIKKYILWNETKVIDFILRCSPETTVKLKRTSLKKIRAFMHQSNHVE